MGLREATTLFPAEFNGTDVAITMRNSSEAIKAMNAFFKACNWSASEPGTYQYFQDVCAAVDLPQSTSVKVLAGTEAALSATDQCLAENPLLKKAFEGVCPTPTSDGMSPEMMLAIGGGVVAGLCLLTYGIHVCCQRHNPNYAVSGTTARTNKTYMKLAGGHAGAETKTEETGAAASATNLGSSN